MEKKIEVMSSKGYDIEYIKFNIEENEIERFRELSRWSLENGVFAVDVNVFASRMNIQLLNEEDKPSLEIFHCEQVKIFNNNSFVIQVTEKYSDEIIESNFISLKSTSFSKY